MREEIDSMKDQFDLRMYLHAKFKKHIKYKDRLGNIEPMRNEEFSQTLGQTFLKR